MEIGLVLPHTGPNAGAAHLREVSTAAEASGLDCLWAVDHVVLPHRTASPYPLGRAPAVLEDGALGRQLAPNLELVVTLSWVAGFTSTIGLGTSIALITARNPVVNARQMATLDRLSGGRLTYGVGVGWLREEIEAVGERFEGRGARAEEHVDLLRTLWETEDELVEHHGRHIDLPPVHPEPRPAQRRVPILFGGHSPVALERAGRLADGWIAAPMSPERLAESWAEVRRHAARHGRDPHALRLVAAAANAADGLERLVESYAEVGVDHLQLRLNGDAGTAAGQVERFGELRRRVAG